LRVYPLLRFESLAHRHKIKGLQRCSPFFSRANKPPRPINGSYRRDAWRRYAPSKGSKEPSTKP
jgi:hypothetical protein